MSLASDLAQYEADRRELILQDRALRADHVRDDLSQAEINADAALRNIRAAEAATIWSAEYPTIPHPFPGMEFLTGKSIIQETKLFQILQKMPKGGLLHAHLDATVSAEFLYKLGLRYPTMHIRVPNALTASNIGSVLPEFHAQPEDFRSADVQSLTHPDYSPDDWVPLETARKLFDASLGGPEGFDRWVVGTMTINPTEAYVTHNTVTKIWQKFSSTFRVASGLIRYIPIFAEYIREFFLTSIEDGVSYVEPRINFLYKIMTSAEGKDDVTHRDFMLVFERTINEVKAEMKRQGREDEFIGAKLIYTTIRFITPEELEWYLEDCIALKKEFPHLIAGFDLVGDENVLRPLSYYTEKLLWFRRRQKEAGVDIPFILHAGETLGDGTEADMNLYDAILLGTKRIGHGFSLVKHPKLMEICKTKGIALEVCPISNEILRLTSSMPMHPLPILFNNGIPVALCSDDPSVFGNMGLTYDFYQVIAASEVTGLIQLGEIAQNSIKFSMLDPEDKQRALDAWKRRWIKFLEYVEREGAEFAAASK